MRIFIVSLLLFINAILQSTLLQYLRIRDILPSFTIIIILSFGLLRGSVEGAIIGFFAGLLYDVQFGQGIGFHALLGMYLGYFTGKITIKFYRESYMLPFVVSIGSVFIYEHIVYILHYLLRGNIKYWFFLKEIIIPEIVYTAILAPLLYQLIWRINHGIEQRENRKK